MRAGRRSTARRNTARVYVSRPAGLLISSPIRTRIRRRCSSFAPCILRMTGRAKSSKVTELLTGLPGSPMKTASRSLPISTGLPGRMATRQVEMVPSSAATSRTQSWSPTLTPALLTTRSDADAASSIARTDSFESRAMPRNVGVPPASRTAAVSIGELESTSCAGPGGVPAGTSSSPVASSATRGRPPTRRRS